MTSHKLLLLTLFLVKWTHQTNETDFKPIDSRTAPIIDRFLNNQANDSVSQVLDEFQSIFTKNVIKQKEQEMLEYFRSLLNRFDNYNVSKGIQLIRVSGVGVDRDYLKTNEVESSVVEDLLHYAENHVIKIQLNDLVEDVTNRMKSGSEMLDSSERSARFLGGNNTFLTGFALGFLAFGLKKLMLPFMIGVQIVKSVLFAMFLPSLLGGLGKVVGEGVKYLSSQRYPATGMGHNMGQMEEFEFKDPNGYENQQYPDTQAEGSASLLSYAYPNAFEYNKPSIGVFPGTVQSSIANRYTSGTHKLNYIPNNNYHGSFYTKHNDKHGKHQDYKVFHNIPSSSLLLTNYDPFYSPLLSRMDSVFKQLGYDTEACRERLICLMYKNPAKFAPYSNLISAQLSRELNELRKPSTDNPDILRFFKYMKAAKDGQDGVDCIRTYSGCFDNRESISPPMVKTFNEINKLVHARKFFKYTGLNEDGQKLPEMIEKKTFDLPTYTHEREELIPSPYLQVKSYIFEIYPKYNNYASGSPFLHAPIIRAPTGSKNNPYSNSFSKQTKEYTAIKTNTLIQNLAAIEEK